MKTLISAALYIAIIHYAYVSYTAAVFEYAHYNYIAREITEIVATYFLSWVVVLGYKNSSHPAQSIAGLIYILCYVPIQQGLLFSVEREYVELLPAQFALALSMILIFRAASSGPVQLKEISFQFAWMDYVIGVLTISTLVLIIVINIRHMRLVSFEDVYDLRLDTTSANSSPIVGYLSSWVSYCFLSYFSARGLIHRKWKYLGLSLVGSIILYMTAGAKASLLMIPMTVGVVLLWQNGGGFLGRALVVLVGIIIFLLSLSSDEGFSMWAKSIILVRTIGNSGWTASKYLEYFEINGYTFYTHIGPINTVFGGYPYGDYSLGQLIGIQFSGTPEANFNASFWASDGLAAMGVVGIYIITLPLIVFLYLLNRLTMVFHHRFTVSWFIGFAVAVLNVPFTTAILSGGGGIILLLTWIASKHSSKVGVDRNSLKGRQ